MHASVTATTSHCSVTTHFKSTQRQLTVMLVTICCAAVCLQSPYTIVYLLNAEKNSLWPDHRTLHAKIYLCRMVTDVIATSNYAVNFALYCVSGSSFRQSVGIMCRRYRKRRRHASTHQYQAAVTASPTLVNPNRLNSKANSCKTSDAGNGDNTDRMSHF